MNLSVFLMSDGAAAKVPLMISKALYEEIEGRIRSSDGLFKTPEEYVSFIMSEVVKEEKQAIGENGLSAQDDEEIKEKLKSLGYL